MDTSNTVRSRATRRSRSLIAPVLTALGLFAATALPLSAVEPLRSGQWWGTFELGAGQLDRTMSGFSDNSARFYLGLGGGMAVDPHLLLGIEASGWLIQAENANDPTKGAGISRVFAVARIYPQPTSTFHFEIGAGSITGWDNSPWSLNHTGSPSGSNRNGSGWEAGIGYDMMVSSHMAFTPFLRYSSGTAGSMKMSAVTLGVGLTWR
jgi:hypothetical protein